MGPTASGKTDLAITLAEALGGELVSVDSALVYRGLDIGSAKPSYPHALVDICDPAEAYSAARFLVDARAAIARIRDAGRRPILVGGTMLYFRALLEGLAPMPGADPALRAKLGARAAEEGWPALHEELRAVDPESAARIHPNHSQRILRALEVFYSAGRPLSALHGEGRERRAAPDERPLCVALAPLERSVLHARIEARFARMLQDGFLDEVRALHARADLNISLPAVRAVGYRQLWAYLDGEDDLASATSRALAASRQLAKRQFTWLRKWPELRWLHTDAAGRVVSSDLPWTGELPADPADVLLNYLSVNPM